MLWHEALPKCLPGCLAAWLQLPRLLLASPGIVYACALREHLQPDDACQAAAATVRQVSLSLTFSLSFSLSLLVGLCMCLCLLSTCHFFAGFGSAPRGHRCIICAHVWPAPFGCLAAWLAMAFMPADLG